MKQHVIILLIFIILTSILTYPLVFHIGEAVQEPGDSLFNTWIIAWDVRALLRDPLNIFNTNIFYPYKYTLAYSEHLIGLGLSALPVYLFTRNHIFIYNFMLILSFILCGWGTYLLVYNLTKNRLAGIVSGVIFGFCPYRFDQFGHLHVLTSQWIPFCLVFLHKISERKDRRFWLLLGFGFFFFLQFLSTGHNGLYLTLAVILFLLYFRKDIGVYPWLVFFIVFILILPFYYPYFYLAREFGFERMPYEFKLHSPQLSSYLAVPSGNWLYGRFLSGFTRPEAVMFPGLIALVLVFWRRIPRFRFKRKKSIHPIINIIINIFILINILVIIGIIFAGGFDLRISIFGLRLKVSDFSRPVYIVLFLFGIKIIANWKKAKAWINNIVKNIIKNKGPEQFYWILAIIAFLLSFGPMIRAMDKDVIWGPYSLLYNFVPGFKGIRVSGRIYVLFILAISVLAGFGLDRLSQSIQGCLKKRRFRKICYITWIIPLIILAEYINLPISLNCWIGNKPSGVHKWLADQKDNSVIIELPMPDWYSKFSHEIIYVYWSIYHGKKMINGYSGYFPPTYWPIAERMRDFPDPDTIEILKYIGVRYVIIHEDEIRNWNWASFVERMDRFKDVFTLRLKEGDIYIYELMDRIGESLVEPEVVPISKNKWIISTNYNIEDAYKAIDINKTTHWHSDIEQRQGIFIDLDLGSIENICMISMYFNNAFNNYPRGIELEISKDRKNWVKIPLKLIYANYVKHLIKYPNDNRMILSFKPEETRYIRLTQTGNHDKLFWSIYELDVYSP